MHKYIGHIDPSNPSRREYVPGIPARDISDKEAKERGWEETLKASPAYEHQGDETPKAQAKEVKENG